MPDAEVTAGPDAPPRELPFRRVAILGFGLIGGSIARALKARPGIADEVVARSGRAIALSLGGRWILRRLCCRR